ncbi:MAG: hypothetical protein Q9191_006585 [Dirinaria sp. TL-2023a]
MVKLVTSGDPRFDVQKDSLIIALLGVTGAGKTTFISKATGRTDLKIGHDIESCTKEISAINFKISNTDIVLLDTPGFDDTDVSDVEVLNSIGDFLQQTYNHKKLLTGVILLQPVTGNKIQGNETRRLRLFKKILGEEAYSHVIIATTMWSGLNDREAGVKQVDQRKDKYWDDLIKGGASVVEHDNSGTTAIEIIRMLIDKEVIALQMQKELEEAHGVLLQTSAGKQLFEDKREDIERFERQLKTAERELSEASADKQALMEEVEQLKDELEMKVLQQETLKSKRVSFSSQSSFWCQILCSLLMKVMLSETVPNWLRAIATIGGVTATGLGCNVL